jgi:hypothetical protein
VLVSSNRQTVKATNPAKGRRRPAKHNAAKDKPETESNTLSEETSPETVNSEDYPDGVNTPDPDDQTEPADTPDDQTDEAATEEAQAEEEPAKPASKSIFGAKPEKPTEEEKPKSEPVSRNSIFSKVG